MKISPEMDAALAACANEPIHIPGAIQDFGVLVCLDENLQYVQQVSNNVADLLDLPVAACLEAAGSHLLGELLIEQLRSALQNHEKIAGAFPANLGTASTPKQRVYVNAYRTGNSVVVELEPMEPEPLVDFTEQHQLPIVNDWIGTLTRSQAPDELLDNLVLGVRSFTGYDRILVYKFDSSFNGAVVAESRAEFLSPFLDHHFPASDIPPQARAMYQHNAVRVIADSRETPVPLIPQENPETGRPLDLSLGALRAVSPIHQQYLQNMGVGSAVSIAIFSDTGLWGLVSCHSQSPKLMPLSVRESAATITQVASQRLFLLDAQAEAGFRSAVQCHRERFIGRIHSATPEDIVRDQADGWRELLSACGLAFSHRGALCCQGKAPPADEIRALINWLETQATDPMPWASDSLTKSGYTGNIDMDCGCGVLAIPLASDLATKSWLLFFRPEKKRTIDWGGKPEDLTVDMKNHPALSPRRSFATWQEVVHGTSEPWRADEQLAIQDLSSDLMVAISANEIARLNTDLRREQAALAEANERLRQLALIDPLTGAGNRQRMEDEIDSALRRALRYDDVFSLLLFDVDHFKSINDKYGHNQGDQVLKQMVQQVEEFLRDADTLGRWGGEEFVVLMPDTDESGAHWLAERLLQQVAATDFGLSRRVTVSIGVTQWQPQDDRTKLVARADAAMYAAKERGRNRVCISDTGGLEN